MSSHFKVKNFVDKHYANADASKGKDSNYKEISFACVDDTLQNFTE